MRSWLLARATARMLAPEGRLVCANCVSSTFSPRNTALARSVSARISSHIAASCPSEISMYEAASIRAMASIWTWVSVRSSA
jgi:hypothetical protein